MKKIYTLALAAALMLICSAVSAQEKRPTGLPANYPADGVLPSWYKGCPSKPLVSYHAYSWTQTPQDESEGEVYWDAESGNRYTTTKGPDREPMRGYVVDGNCYLILGDEKRLLKVPVEQFDNAASSANNLAGLNFVEEKSSNIIEQETCEYKHRLVVHTVTETTTIFSFGLGKETSTTESWIDCETGITLAAKDYSGYGSPNHETYGIVIGPQPASKFILPEGYEIVDLAKSGGLMGLTTGKSQEENTQDVNNAIGGMMDAIQKVQGEVEKYLKK